MQYTTSKVGKRAKAGQRDGTHPKRGSRSAPPALGGHHHQRHTRHDTPAPHFKNMFRFCPFLSPKIPRKHQAPPKIHLLLTLFAENLPR